MIAFSTRRMVGYELLGKSESETVRVFTAGSTLSLSQLDGVFHTDYTDYLFGTKNGSRTRAIEKHPELGLNKLFVLNVEAKRLRQLTKDNQHFSPTWSPDARTVAAVVDVKNAVNPLSSAHTELALFDVATGNERRVAVPFPIIGGLQWSTDGTTIAMLCKKQYFGFSYIRLYSVRDGHWSSIATPQGTTPSSIRWASDNHSLLVRTLGRFVDTLWLIDPTNNEVRQIDTNDLSLSFLNEGIDQDRRGDIFFVASTSTSSGQIFERAARSAEPLRQVYDANPQLSALRFGQQRRITWTNKAGEEVDGIVILPADYEPRRRYPLIVDVYPRAAKDELHLAYGGMGQLEAADGYVVFLPDLRAPHVFRTYRGDERYNERARGAKGIPVMVDDFDSGVEYLARQGFVDPDRVGIFGHSNGGYAANLLITETKIPKCAVVGSARSNLIFDRYFYPDLRYWIDQIRDLHGDIYDHDDFQEFVKMSPLFRMNKVQVPVFMYVGDRDLSWLPEMLMEFNALRQLGKDVTLVRYSEEDHSPVRPDDVRDLVDRVHAFFDKNLKPAK